MIKHLKPRRKIELYKNVIIVMFKNLCTGFLFMIWMFLIPLALLIGLTKYRNIAYEISDYRLK